MWQTPAQPINLIEFEAAAKEQLSKEEYDYITGGAIDEVSVNRNRRASASWAFRPRFPRDVGKLDLLTTVLESRVELPVLIAPCGGHKRAHPEGERATYRAAATCGTVLAVSANAAIVSNHGGRHLDNTLATVEDLSEAVVAAKGKMEVLLVVGVRRGAESSQRSLSGQKPCLSARRSSGAGGRRRARGGARARFAA